MGTLVNRVQPGFRILNLLTAFANGLSHYSVEVSLGLDRLAVLHVRHVHCIDHFAGILGEQIVS